MDSNTSWALSMGFENMFMLLNDKKESDMNVNTLWPRCISRMYAYIMYLYPEIID